MKKLSLLVGWTLLTSIASAAPYVVYSGYATMNVNNSPAKVTVASYLLTDLADTSQFAILHYVTSDKQAVISVFPLTNPTTAQANLNFFGSVDGSNGGPSLGVLSIGDMTTDSSNNSNIFHWYATGPLTTKNTTLVRSRPRSITMMTRSGGAATGPATFPAASAVTTSGQPFAPTLNGTAVEYLISPTGTLTYATGPASFSMTVNPVLTAAANNGGPFTLNARNITALNPVDTSSATISQAYTTWLTSLAGALGVVLPVTVNGGDSGSILGSETFVTGGLSVAGTGTLVVSATGTQTLTNTDTGTFSLNVGGGGPLPGPGQTEPFTQAFSVGGETLTITGVDGDGTINGQLGGRLIFNGSSSGITGATLSVDGATQGFQANTAYTGEVVLSGGTVTNTNGVISFTGSTLTITTGTVSPTNP